MRVELDRARTIAEKALDNGGALIRPRTVDWDVAGKCANPFNVLIEGRPMRKPLEASGTAKCGKTFAYLNQRYDRATTIGERNAPLWVDLSVGCRQCPACLQRRGIHWRERAKVEINCAERTWFGTLTLSPHEHWQSELRAGPEIYSALPDEKFRLLHRAISPLITRYIKRLRKDAGQGLRVICVAEAHKSGKPHYHLLVHERHGCAVRHAKLASKWSHGFSKWKLVNDGDKAASYVAKYLFKSSLARVRASAGYGDSITALGLSGSADVQTADRVKNEMKISPQNQKLEANGLNERSDQGYAPGMCSTEAGEN